MWKDAEPSLRLQFGEHWDVWISRLIPESDRDGVLTLATSTMFERDYVAEHFAIKIGVLCSREVRVVQRGWAGLANERMDRDRRELEKASVN